ncbi:MoaD/ThiS family protein [Pseudomonas sp. LPB0260]|uniref:MoaD/ThiS family protein n=1 Tax=unclassified Pseudomonas TaxID=196821 RepID=UPI0015C2728A|nr:MoaD/ThiS family protein [Pseudomonas sp. LPB0260]QLC73602.1 MoaD/ThiS family protein [Pseudomonas sp. LPB0260]QLC76376.1 MoaD/ThiS family protein [Pseudomonas sp. LPB0260]
MAHVSFTRNLHRHLDVAACEAAGATVGEVLGEVFAGNPRLRSYLLDDQGRLRQHVAIFVDGSQVRDRRGLSDRVASGSEIFVVQALSGG